MQWTWLQQVIMRSKSVRVVFESILPDNPLEAPWDTLPPLTVLIPCIIKDAAILPTTVEALGSAVQNPIERIVVLCPDDEVERMRQLVPDHVDIVSENSLPVPLARAAIDELVPRERRGWVWQQVLKLAAVAMSDAQGVLVVDADTVLLQPRTWLREKRQLLPLARESHLPYVHHTRVALGRQVDVGPMSWVTHHQLMQPQVVRSMLDSIERCGSAARTGGRLDGFSIDRALETWVRSADFREESALSEYHTYGCFLRSLDRHGAVLARWGNAITGADHVAEQLDQFRSTRPDALSVSCHSYAS